MTNLEVGQAYHCNQTGGQTDCGQLPSAGVGRQGATNRDAALIGRRLERDATLRLAGESGGARVAGAQDVRTGGATAPLILRLKVRPDAALENEITAFLHQDLILGLSDWSPMMPIFFPNDCTLKNLETICVEQKLLCQL